MNTRIFPPKSMFPAILIPTILAAGAVFAQGDRVKLDDVKIEGEVHKNAARFLQRNRFSLGDQVKIRRDFRAEILESIAFIDKMPPEAAADAKPENRFFSAIGGWRYLPLDEKLVNEFENALRDKEVSSQLPRLQKIRASAKGLPAEAEARLLVARACEAMGLKYCSYRTALSIGIDFPGSAAAMRGLVLLSKLQQQFPFVDTELSHLVNSGSFREVPASLVPMVSYYFVIENARKKNFSWATPATAALRGEDAWSLRWKYLRILNDLRAGEADAAIAKLEELAGPAAKVSPILSSSITLQLARLKYETGRLEEAEKIYRSISADTRRGARALRERAWVHYSRKDISQTLGLLEALRANAFSTVTDPEQYVLAMMALRDLCRYDAVKGVTKNFRARYKTALSQIRKRKNPSDQLQIGLLSAMKTQFEPWMETVALLRRERKMIQANEVDLPKDLRAELLKAYDADEKALRAELEIKIADDLRTESARLLAVDEQVKLVDYLSGLDQFRFGQTYETRAYETERISRSSFKVLGWPARGEFWFDELQNYKALVTDRCSTGEKK